jgi:hypothetical protein
LRAGALLEPLNHEKLLLLHQKEMTGRQQVAICGSSQRSFSIPRVFKALTLSLSRPCDLGFLRLHLLGSSIFRKPHTEIIPDTLHNDEQNESALDSIRDSFDSDLNVNDESNVKYEKE